MQYVSKKRILKLFLTAVAICSLAFGLIGCDKKEEVKTVEWYMAPENKAALEEKLAQCKSNPGELKDTPNCINALEAQRKIRIFAPPTPLR